MTDSIDFRAVQEHFGFQTPAPVEKDWHVVRAMRAIIATDTRPFRLIFAGGTCLARAHRLIRRMSEDVDFKVVPIDASPVSRNQRRKQLGELRNRITASLQGAGFAIDRSQIRSRDDNHYSVYQLPYAEPHPSGLGLSPTIQIELTYATLRQPALSLPVISFVTEAYGRAPDVEAMDCVSPTETAAEKLVSVIRRTAMELAGASRAIDPTLVRHLYDLHQLQRHIDRDAAITLARTIAVADAQEFANQYPAYAADIVGETHKALVALVSDPIVQVRYADFLRLMVYGEPVDFASAIAVVTDLLQEAWPEQGRT